jgi:hypothetical protein
VVLEVHLEVAEADLDLLVRANLEVRPGAVLRDPEVEVELCKYLLKDINLTLSNLSAVNVIEKIFTKFNFYFWISKHRSWPDFQICSY